MALDRQKILNDLGNVMTQLQNADCGCMGKLFSNQGGSGAPNMNNGYPAGYGGYSAPKCCHGNNCHQHGQSSGEPFAHSINSCMGRTCNPAKLFTDTYNYLNPNLMQPIMKEVHDDLKSINNTNTIMNNPMAAQMGLTSQNSNVQPPQNAGMNQMAHGTNVNNMINNTNNPSTGGMAGLGPQIANLMMSSSNPNKIPKVQPGDQVMPGQTTAGQNIMGQPTPGLAMPGQILPGQEMQNQNMNRYASMYSQNATARGMPGQVINSQNMQGHAMSGQLIPGQVIPEQSTIQNMNRNEGMYGQNIHGGGRNTMPQENSIGQHNMQSYIPQNSMGQNQQFAQGDGQNLVQMPYVGQMQMAQPPTEYVTQANMYSQLNQNAGKNTAMENAPMNNMPNLTPQANSNPNAYGVHSQGINKFKQMFPGVIKDDLGFDPMSIALQMNPANQQKVAIDTMNKMMNENRLDRVMDARPAAPTSAEGHVPQAIPGQTMHQQVTQPPIVPQNISNTIQKGQVPMQQQQIFTAVPASPTITKPPPPEQAGAQQLVPNNQLQNSGSLQQQYFVDPNTGAVITQPFMPGNLDKTEEYETGESQEPQSQQPPVPPNQMIKEPIYPVDTSRNYYNTLGQPVQLLPAQNYQSRLPNLPQTLSPQPISSKKINQPHVANVKATMSKTALMDSKPIGKTPSRSQLQHIYNQYKGSQSYTQQNIMPVEQRIYSDNKLNVPKLQRRYESQAPVERVAGDTLGSNPRSIQMNQKAVIEGQIGDVPVNYKPNEGKPKSPELSRKGRNGLQDQSYTSYPTSTAWSFHGTNGDRVPFLRRRAY